jgi:membrane-bound lytic murein transglycosylase D
VYEVIDLRELSDRSRNRVVFEILSKKRISAAMGAYQRALLLLAAHSHPKHPNREQKIILQKMKEARLHRSFRDLAKGLKCIRGQRDNIVQGLLASESFFPKMELIFSKMHVPPELTRLSLVESSFNQRATSKVGASGVWQFMPSIGRKYLIMDEGYQIDERRSPLKSTVAAAKMLRWSHHYLGSWVLAIISYNHGLRGLPRLKEVNATFANTAHLFDAHRKKPILGWASRSYYCEFLAVLYAEAYRKLFFGDIPYATLRPVSFVQMKKIQSALSFTFENGISLQEFKILNADIQDIHHVLPKGFWVVVPGHSDDITDFVQLAVAHNGAHAPVRKNAQSSLLKSNNKIKSRS